MENFYYAAIPQNLEFNPEFDKNSSIRWYPWIGKNYSNQAKKILVIGESHYYNDKNMKETYDDKKTTWESVVDSAIIYEMNNDPAITNNGLNKGWRNSTWTNFNNMMRSDTSKKSLEIWSDIAFYNFCQDPVKQNNRPSLEIFSKSWDAFFGIVNIIKPDVIIFIGVAALNSFNNKTPPFVDEFKIEWNPEKINNTHPRIINFKLNGKNIKGVGIKHAGKYFSAGGWGQFVRKNLNI